MDYMKEAKKAVAAYANARLAESKDEEITLNDVIIVWFAKTLQNFKALLITPEHYGMYFEVNFNGDKNELYLDAYRKADNMAIKF